ncbi:MAG: hypothetical protein Kow0099_32290 [Candidatus Abyssubacteria bacterium]
MVENGRANDRLKYFLYGGLVGAVSALFLAPKSGAESREAVVSKVKEGKDALERELKAAQERLSKAKEKVEEETRRLISEGKAIINKEEDVVASALEAAKKAYLEEKKAWSKKF